MFADIQQTLHMSWHMYTGVLTPILTSKQVSKHLVKVY